MSGLSITSKRKNISSLTLIILTVFVFSTFSFLILYFYFKPSSVLHSFENGNNLYVIDREWKDVPIPIKSHFGFDDPPNNARLWEEAKSIASQGKQLLLSQVLQQFRKSGYLDFLDGDDFFKKLYEQVDAFVYKETADEVFSVLSNYSIQGTLDRKKFTLPQHPPKYIETVDRKDRVMIEKAHELVPNVYDYTLADRAPMVSLGFNVFGKYKHYLSGHMVASAHYMRRDFVEGWTKYSPTINTPFLAVTGMNDFIITLNKVKIDYFIPFFCFYVYITSTSTSY